MFDDPKAVDGVDRQHSSTERRFRRIGRSSRGAILMVVYTPRSSSDGEEATRIVSARRANRANRAERARYVAVD